MLATTFVPYQQHMSGTPPFENSEISKRSNHTSEEHGSQQQGNTNAGGVGCINSNSVHAQVTASPTESLKRFHEEEAVDMKATKRRRENNDDISPQALSPNPSVGAAACGRSISCNHSNTQRIDPNINHALFSMLPANNTNSSMVLGHNNMDPNATLANARSAAGLHVDNNIHSLLRMDATTIRNTGLSNQLLREQFIRNQQVAAANAMLLAQIGRPNINGVDPSLLGRVGAPGWQNTPFQYLGSLGTQGNFLSNHTNLNASLGQLGRQTDRFTMTAGNGSPNLSGSEQGFSESPVQNVLQRGFPTLLAQNNSNSNPPNYNSAYLARNVDGASSEVAESSQFAPAGSAAGSLQQGSQGYNALRTQMELPACNEDSIEQADKRPYFPLGTDEDPNWLSEFHCFVRSELVEVFRANNDDVKARNNAINHHQVGLRCRFCAHISHDARTGRSSAFPSSLRQIYQSFTMMLRDHFPSCNCIPKHTLDKFNRLKDKPSQGATDSKRFWIHSAMKIGMNDSSGGIVINEQSRSTGIRLAPFGTNPKQKWEDDAFRNVELVNESDRSLISNFLFVLMSQIQPIRLTESECIGNRRSLRVGLPGFGCRHCCEERRLGLCRVFPARRRTLPNKVNDMYDHIRRCTLCPSQVKASLETSKDQLGKGFELDQGKDRDFFDRVWSRLGHDTQSA